MGFRILTMPRPSEGPLAKWQVVAGPLPENVDPEWSGWVVSRKCWDQLWSEATPVPGTEYAIQYQQREMPRWNKPWNRPAPVDTAPRV